MADKELDLVKAEIGANYSLTFEASKGSRLSPLAGLGTSQGSDLRNQATKSMRESMPGSQREHLAASRILTNPCRSNLDRTLFASSAAQLRDS